MSEHSKLRFDESYEERLHLADGREVFLRLIRPTDKQRLLEGMARMSAESLYSRFMGPRNDLSPSMLRYLCDVDGFDHFAMGAVTREPDGGEEGVASARFIRLSGEPTTAEPALTVIDEYQGHGLGRALLERLGAAARERGVDRFHCEFLPSNRRIRSLLESYGEVASVDEDAQAVIMELDLPRPTVSRRWPIGLPFPGRGEHERYR